MIRAVTVDAGDTLVHGSMCPRDRRFGELCRLAGIPVSPTAAPTARRIRPPVTALSAATSRRHACSGGSPNLDAATWHLGSRLSKAGMVKDRDLGASPADADNIHQHLLPDRQWHAVFPFPQPLGRAGEPASLTRAGEMDSPPGCPVAAATAQTARAAARAPTAPGAWLYRPSRRTAAG